MNVSDAHFIVKDAHTVTVTITQDERQCCALCLGVIDWHNCGIALGVLEPGLGIGLYNYLYSVTFLVGIGPSKCVIMGPRPSNVARDI